MYTYTHTYIYMRIPKQIGDDVKTRAGQVFCYSMSMEEVDVCWSQGTNSGQNTKAV